MEKCPLCINESKCSLREGLISQATRGGFKDKSLDPEKGTGGPYWRENIWKGFVERTKKAASNGCLHQDEINILATKITKEKEENGELV
jgi:hypothetical protein